MNYDAKTIEAKWQSYWEETGRDRALETSQRPKYYCLDMFPYPSGSGLHVGHWRGYVLSDVWSRYKRLNGYEVLHPMGWDAFGLPAENDAIKKGIHPTVGTARNIANFKEQLKRMGAMFDWSREINTSSPEYYKWTQWIFLQLFDMGLAYRKEMPINWCPSCKTGLANEEVVDGACERCGTPVTKRNMNQWMLRITDYAERLLNDLDDLDWPEKVKKMQANWIGRSEGAELSFELHGLEKRLAVFTTRPDTLYGVTYMVLAPEHPLVSELTTPQQQQAVSEYVTQTLAKSQLARQRVDKTKTGVFTGGYAVHPLTGELLPIWIADYVLMDYGTGAIMAVPAHDQRDFEFARQFQLPVRRVIKMAGVQEVSEQNMQEADVRDGTLMNSGPYDGLTVEEAKRNVVLDLEAKGIAKRTVGYKLRDWVFARQRYWGEPIPVVHCERCGIVPVKEEDLPVLLPDVERYEPTGTGESPLAAIESFVQTTCPKCKGPAKRETDTMPQWAGSCWYFLRFADPHNAERLFDREKVDYWLPVDMYIGGVEHAVLHLLYARFFTKVLYDRKVIGFHEPFVRLFNQGMMTLHGAKMSKSKGNVVSPEELVEKYGTDTLRMYELFVGPPEVDAEWNPRAIEGVHRFLARTYRLIVDAAAQMQKQESRSLGKLRHRFVQQVTERIEGFRFNTVVSAFMEYVAALSEQSETLDQKTLDTLVICLAPLAPHLAEECWRIIGNQGSVFDASWPEVDERYLVDDTVVIVVQINGKIRDRIEVARETEQEQVRERVFASPSVQTAIADKTIVKEVYVPGKIFNLVVR
ncbi:leucine--tRNA ligase [Sulfoacidibacillus thermotolerans]|uniref:Leucine--tRNA ligase n=1 Tax=Sulfoacidibacillus thermotolerans TaxID=1765684 RepID=A0A2U3DAS3_SULT2|nr:leucine--tRNA ligase [Sulfoacidibacillus thermotolerans]PWI58380.1 leucine--tRNA ligase [Sulfoacidibacillus thermotolerans]